MVYKAHVFHWGNTPTIEFQRHCLILPLTISYLNFRSNLNQQEAPQRQGPCPFSLSFIAHERLAPFGIMSECELVNPPKWAAFLFSLYPPFYSHKPCLLFTYWVKPSISPATLPASQALHFIIFINTELFEFPHKYHIVHAFVPVLMLFALPESPSSSNFLQSSIKSSLP